MYHYKILKNGSHFAVFTLHVLYPIYNYVLVIFWELSVPT